MQDMVLVENITISDNNEACNAYIGDTIKNKNTIIYFSDFESPDIIIDKIILYLEYLTYNGIPHGDIPLLTVPELIFYGTKEGDLKWFMGYEEVIAALKMWLYKDNPMKWLEENEYDRVSIWLLDEPDHSTDVYMEALCSIMPISRADYVDCLL